MTIVKTEFSAPKFLKRPLSDAVCYALTALIVVAVWTFGIVLTSLDFDMLRSSYSSDGEPRSIKAAILADTYSFGQATGAKRLKEKITWTSPNGAITYHYVTAQLKGGNTDGFYVVALVQEENENKVFYADILTYSRTEEQNKIAADVYVEIAELNKAADENKHGGKLDTESFVKSKNIGELFSVSDFEEKYSNEYECHVVDGEWAKVKDTFYFFTSETYLSSGEIITKYKIVRARDGELYERDDPEVLNIAECDTEDERDSVWKECLETYKQSIRELEAAGEYRS